MITNERGWRLSPEHCITNTNVHGLLGQLNMLYPILGVQVKKAYGKNIDNMEMQEELARMREYALKQLDKNGDSLISLQEFLAYTQGAQFEDNEEWKGVVDQPEVRESKEVLKDE